MSDDQLIQKQIDQNYEAFVGKLPGILDAHRNKFALMRNGEIIDFFDTANDAFTAGQKLYDDHLFSVQEVVGTPVDLGYFSHAVSE